MRKLTSLVPIFLIFVVWVILAYANFTPGTWLTGWDNLHPEFNFSLNISRALSAVWQEYQGVGLLGGMAHAADLPRELILLPVSVLLPAHLIRYFWTFLMLLIGPLGVYFLVTKILLKKEGKWLKSTAGFAGSIFYLLNLATVQTFFTPFEIFVSFYGFFPWLLLSALNFLELGGKRNLLKLILVSILATTSFYVQTLFIVYLLVLLFPALEISVRQGLSGFKRLLVLGFTILAVNSFWLFPATYFGLTNSAVVPLSHQNSIATPETQIYNEARGNLADIALLRGYWFDYYDLGNDNKFDYLYSNWMSYLADPQVQNIGYAIFIAALLGLGLQVLNKKSSSRISGVFVFLLTYFMLATINPPFGNLFGFVSEKMPLFAEVFRNAFTKWSVAAAFIYAVGLSYLISAFGKILNKNFLKPLIFIPLAVFLFGAVNVVKPVFDGNLISSSMRISIPSQYFDAMKFLNSREEGRVALLPLQSFWGWNFYAWGYRGSGFIWYGLADPILDRAFDVWSPDNESFYSEAAFALYANDNEAFLRTLEKYQVKYLLLDESVINPGGGSKLLRIQEIKDILASNHFTQVAKFGPEALGLTIYESDFNTGNKFVSAPNEFTRVNANLNYSQIDTIYSKYNNYIEDEKATFFPFANFDNRSGKIVLPTSSAIKEDFTAARGFSGGYNCDLKKKGSAVKKKNSQGNFYAADSGGVSCDYFYYPELLYNQGYLLRIKGENTLGRGLKIYLQNNSTGQMDLQELLPTGSFDKTFAILPKPNLSGDMGYTLNVETRSFGKIASQNLIEKIEFYPMDFFYLAGLYQGNAPEVTKNNLSINRVQKYGTWLYKIDTEGNGLVVLGQGHNDGWVAFEMANGQWPIVKKLTHTKVNSWENGWIINGQNLTLNHQPLTIIIVYWPQFLEYFGFALLILSLIYILKVDKA